jgi:deoxycytidine triphosphate deaminase
MEDTVKHILSKTNDSELTNVQEGDSQPNAVDLRVSKIFKMDGQFLISEDKKVHRTTEELIPDEKDWWSLDTGVYEIVMENIVSVGEGYAGFVITRSTLNRNGVFITSGLYDSGYHGVMAGALHVRGGKTYIKKGTRVGQFIMFEAETLSLYDGSYGIGKQHDNKYGEVSGNKH